MSANVCKCGYIIENPPIAAEWAYELGGDWEVIVSEPHPNAGHCCGLVAEVRGGFATVCLMHGSERRPTLAEACAIVRALCKRHGIEITNDDPIDTEPLSPELDAALDQRIAEVRAGTVACVEVTVPNEDAEGGTTT